MNVNSKSIKHDEIETKNKTKKDSIEKKVEDRIKNKERKQEQLLHY